ncbi:MAG TPA: ROK family transcriptional regulator [Trebonia sp.]|nr:ROK family transcriptional regulator [Trebonia sp.]
MASPFPRLGAASGAPGPAAAGGPAAPINLRRLGRVRVLEALARYGALSRADLVRHTGLARASVGTVIFDLMRSGLVEETAEEASPGIKTGRPPQVFGLVPGAGYALGVDIGHDHVRAVLTNLSGTPCWDRSSPRLAIDHDPWQALASAADLSRQALGDAGVPRESVLGIGLGIACPVNADSGDLAADGIMQGWAGIRPADELAERTGFPVRIINDANACVLAEQRYGAARESADVIYLRLSSGIGAGVISGGRMLVGGGGVAGELGHVTVEPSGAVCRCGNRGCLETVASPAALTGLLARSWGRPVSDTDLTWLVRDGDRGTLRAVGDAGDAVGRVLAPAVQLLNPGLIVIGGELAAAGEVLFEPIRRALARGIMPSHTRGLRIVPGALGDSAGARGAAALILDGAPRQLGMERTAPSALGDEDEGGLADDD